MLILAKLILSFTTVTETDRFLAILKEIPEIIVVGIGYPIDSFAQSSFEDARLYHQKLLKLYNLMRPNMLVQVKRQIFSNLFANN
ncbi:hypothetical protein MiSe_63250 [Microseira wollei NIES-4236]|uniref:Uncharacterized protein n=1 Tax=Microseira wollei NIES-4236 TaxID=2530354 RepID=A0AAV3XFZ7_9CYAN|nr:hypothetical protein MiSe_63250 [Microseira wollei NIES-4236]